MLPFHVAAEHIEKDAAADVLLLVDSAWLKAHLQDPALVVLDARSPGEYQQGHIKGAINFPAIRTYQDASKRRVVLQQDFESMLGALGIGNKTHVVVYGDAVYQAAARVFWVFELFGHEKLSLLNGAFPAWKALGLPVDIQQPSFAPVSYRAAMHPGRMATRLQVQLAIDNANVSLVDAREFPEYQGAQSTAARFGHIPGAINVPKRDNLEVRQGTYYLKPVASLEKLYAGVEKSGRTILYCQSGSESAIGYFALRLMNKTVSLYDGAWLEWGNDARLPIVSQAK